MALKVGVAWRSADPAEVCGDRADWWSRDGSDILMIADGIGHGKAAATASSAAIEVVAAWQGFDVLNLFRDLNEKLRLTRGAAIGVAVVNWATSEVTYAAVGNTQGALFGAGAGYLRGYAGTVGAGYRRLNTTTLRFNRGHVLALWTDGLNERITLTLADRSVPQLDDTASRLLERFARGNDDCCIVVAHLVQG